MKNKKIEIRIDECLYELLIKDIDILNRSRSAWDCYDISKYIRKLIRDNHEKISDKNY